MFVQSAKKTKYELSGPVQKTRSRIKSRRSVITFIIGLNKRSKYPSTLRITVRPEPVEGSLSKEACRRKLFGFAQESLVKGTLDRKVKQAGDV